MSKIKIKTIIKLACAGAAVILSIAMCATPLTPLGIGIAVCGAIIFGCDAIEFIESSFHHTDIVQPDTNITNITNLNHHIDYQSKGSANSDDGEISVFSSDTFYSADSYDSAITLESSDLNSPPLMGLTSDSLATEINS